VQAALNWRSNAASWIPIAFSTTGGWCRHSARNTERRWVDIGVDVALASGFAQQAALLGARQSRGGRGGRCGGQDSAGIAASQAALGQSSEGVQGRVTASV
jgi:hypothetical protein